MHGVSSTSWLPRGAEGAGAVSFFWALFHRGPRLVLQIVIVNTYGARCNWSILGEQGLLFFFRKTVPRFPSGRGNAGRNHACKPAICVSFDLMTSLRS